MSAFDRIREVYFGGSEMPLPLGPGSLRRLMWVSLAPGVILAAAVIHAALTLTFDNSALYGFPSSDDGFFGGSAYDQAGLFWRRLYAATEALQVLQPLALALLFAAGLQRWSRAEGSWMRVVGISLAGLAFAPGAFVVGSFTILDRADAQDLEIFTWMSLSSTFGMMAVGYFFLAYRGATSPD